MAEPFSYCPVRQALLDGDRNKAIQLIRGEKHDPFVSRDTAVESGMGRIKSIPFNGCMTAFHEAAEQHDLELLLIMAEADDEEQAEWKPRYFVSQFSLVPAPCKGRTCIPTAEVKNRTLALECEFFISEEAGFGMTVESLEAMWMYGYHPLTSVEWKHLVGGEEKQAVIEFCIAANQFPETKKRKSEILFQCLFRASLTGDSLLSTAQTLILAGADPSGCILQDGEREQFPPPLYLAFRRRNSDLVKLLLEFGADQERAFQFDDTKVDQLLRLAWNLEFRGHSPPTVEEMKSMVKAAQPLHKIHRPDPNDFILSLQRKFISPIKPLARDYVAPLIAATMRFTSKAPTLGLMSKLVLEYAPPGDFNLWPIRL